MESLIKTEYNGDVYSIYKISELYELSVLKNNATFGQKIGLYGTLKLAWDEIYKRIETEENQ